MWSPKTSSATEAVVATTRLARANRTISAAPPTETASMSPAAHASSLGVNRVRARARKIYARS
jgi:hypothetical protein